MLEPVDLVLVEGVVDGEGVFLAVGLGGIHGQGDTGGERLEPLDGELVCGLDDVVVGRVGEGQGEHALLLQVGLVDAGKGADDHCSAAEVAGLQGSVLTGGALAVVLIADNDPLDALGL